MWWKPKNSLMNRRRCRRSSLVSVVISRIDRIFFWFLSCVACLAPSSARSHVVINEIYYDHPGSDNGYEFVELYNASETSVSLHNLSLQFHNGAAQGWETIWTGHAGDSIPGGEVYVVGESSVTPLPDDVIGLTLQNGPDALQLLLGSALLDVVGYGGLDDPAYCESAGVPKVSPGFSVGRKPDGKDSDDNRQDFARMMPSPGRFNQPRRDVSVQLSHEHSGERSFLPGQGVPVQFCVRNEGLHEIGALALQMSVWDSTDVFCDILLSSTNDDALDAGDSLSFGTAALLSSGYHCLIGRVWVAGDERKENNEAAVVVRVGAPDVLISEVMSYPAESCPQYVEIFNGGLGEIDLGGWTVRDGSHPPSLITEHSLLCPPATYSVVTEHRERLLAWFPHLPEDRVIELAGPWPTLNHTGTANFADSIVVADAYGIAVDGVDYPPQGSDHRGKSLERVDLYPGVGPHVWVLSSSTGGGSPGAAADAVLSRPPGPLQLTVHPNPFSPVRGEALLITLGARMDRGTAVVSIFDLNGRKIKTIGTTSQFPAVFVWDGKREESVTVEAGLYIVTCEFHARDGGGMGVERVVVGCGRRTR